MARGMSFKGVYEEVVTHKAHASLTKADEGKAVTLVGDSQVGLGTDGAPLEGKLVKLESDGYCSVAIGRYLDLPYTGAAPALDTKVVVDGAGNVKAYATDTIANAMKGRGAVKSIDATKLKVIVRTDA